MHLFCTKVLFYVTTVADSLPLRLHPDWCRSSSFLLRNSCRQCCHHSTMLPHCLCNNGVPTTTNDFPPLIVGYNPAGRECSFPTWEISTRPNQAHGDPPKFGPRLVRDLPCSRPLFHRYRSAVYVWTGYLPMKRQIFCKGCYNTLSSRDKNWHMWNFQNSGSLANVFSFLWPRTSQEANRGSSQSLCINRQTQLQVWTQCGLFVLSLVAAFSQNNLRVFLGSVYFLNLFFILLFF